MPRHALALMLVATGCVEDAGTSAGTGFLAAGLAEQADRVQVAWIHFDASQFVEVVELHGAVPIEDGAFSLDDLLASQADFTPPTSLCPLEVSQPTDIEEAAETTPAPYAWGAIVATVEGAEVPDAAPIEDLEEFATATTTEFAILWTTEAVPRDSLWGHRIESSLAPGLQLVSVRECRLGLECQTQCFDPLGDEAFILLGRL